MSNTKALDDRMKEYEYVTRYHLTRRLPVVIRIDGKAFHTYCKGMIRPFDKILTQAMEATMVYLCSNIQGCVFGYRQSDEISLLLIDYNTIQTDGWFDYNLQKMASVSASMATMAFNDAFRIFVNRYDYSDFNGDPDVGKKYYDNMRTKVGEALFDSRVWSLPMSEVCNYFIWRQQDATRNSIMSLGQAHFSQKQLHGKSTDQVQDMLFKEYGINWNDVETHNKRGMTAYRVRYIGVGYNPKKPEEEIKVIRNKVISDYNIPIFTQDRQFVERWLDPEFALEDNIGKDFKDKSGVVITKNDLL